MKLFSERYGYTHPSDVIIRERITPEIQNAICNCYDKLPKLFQQFYTYYDKYTDLELHIWTKFLNMRESNFYDGFNHRIVATSYLEAPNNQWYKKLDLIEFTIKYLISYESEIFQHLPITNQFINLLNTEFKRLNFAYRIINHEIVEITSENEIKSIETALHDTNNNIRTHLNNALELYSLRPQGDYRNSIKESISAVEAYCREKTGETTLGKALKHIEDSGREIQPLLKEAFTKLYAYTNQPETGIRHALMDETETYTPSSDEALFMLVTCSAFINYLNKQETNLLIKLPFFPLKLTFYEL